MCKDMYRGIYGNQWTPGAEDNVTMDQFYTWAKVYDHESDSDHISGADWFKEF